MPIKPININIGSKGQKIIDLMNGVTPAEQRLILGATALLTQPLIDTVTVDKEHRDISVAKTVAKILVCTATGFLIRFGCIKGVGYGITKGLFQPTGGIQDAAMGEKYASALGTLIATGAMLFTNFLVDAPLTKLLTDKFTKKIRKANFDKIAAKSTPGNVHVDSVAQWQNNLLKFNPAKIQEQGVK